MSAQIKEFIRRRRKLFTNKRFNTARRYDNYKHVGT